MCLSSRPLASHPGNSYSLILFCTFSYGLCFSTFGFNPMCSPILDFFFFPNSSLSAEFFNLYLLTCVLCYVPFSTVSRDPCRGGTGSEGYSKLPPTIYFTFLLVLLNTLFAIMTAANTAIPPLSRGRHYG